jgi:hypothetical protein
MIGKTVAAEKLGMVKLTDKSQALDGPAMKGQQLTNL